MDEVKPKRVRRSKYRFIGAGKRMIDGKLIGNGDICMLLKRQVTKEWEHVSG